LWGKHDHNRPALHRALEARMAYGTTLVIAKLDRHSRYLQFLLGVQKAGVKFVAADMLEANEMVVSIMASVAQASAGGSASVPRPPSLLPRRAVSGWAARRGTRSPSDAGARRGSQCGRRS
jgi:hypothetical protein